ncbi:hypothetical protein [Zhihengliuella sp.]|uniref:hypothetical protein n=1 Tax=Zhihengliuella sp. TaxID=1954483 RepID=UPI002811DD0B|nr:hypothetical protein [Zhihengliuella sp.]
MNRTGQIGRAGASPDRRRSHRTGRRIGDAVRGLGFLSVIGAGVWFGAPEFLGFVVVLGGVLVPRLMRLAGPFDAAFGITVLVAAWSGAAGLYEAIPWWDLLVHFITAGAAAAVLYLGLARIDVTPDTPMGSVLPYRSIVVLTSALGMTLAVLWEFLEWAGHTFVSSQIHVGYTDTLGDLAVGGLGSTLAGILLAQWQGRVSEVQSWARA